MRFLRFYPYKFTAKLADPKTMHDIWRKNIRTIFIFVKKVSYQKTFYGLSGNAVYATGSQWKKWQRWIHSWMNAQWFGKKKKNTPLEGISNKSSWNNLSIKKSKALQVFSKSLKRDDISQLCLFWARPEWEIEKGRMRNISKIISTNSTFVRILIFGM